jgi:hypothetical protein
METENESLQAVENRLNMSDSLIHIFTERDRPMEHRTQVEDAIK